MLAHAVLASTTQFSSISHDIIHVSKEMTSYI